MGKLVTGFVLGFLACVWTYGLNPTEAAFNFGHKVNAAHDNLQAEYHVAPAGGHKGNYPGLYRDRGLQSASDNVVIPIPPLAHPNTNWLSQPGGLPPM